MSELRQDPTTKEWVILAPERAARPRQSLKKRTAEALPDWDETCPFCPGNEDKTPEEVLKIPAAGNDAAWAVRVVPNRFAALSEDADPEKMQDERFNRKMPGFGVHEVFIDSPSHNTPMALMTYPQVEKVLTAYQQRYNVLKKNRRLQFITIFKNHGRESGTSLAHPHSQLVATPLVTPYYHRRFDVAHDYFADFGRCLYCDMLKGELTNGERIVIETDQFVVFEPFASRASYETWIIPKLHRASFGMLTPEHITEMASVLKDTLYCLYFHLDDPAFNLMIDTSTTYDEEDPYYHWHIRIMPRLSMIAGFEIGSGIYISMGLPEETAKILQKCCYALVRDSESCIIPSDTVI